MANQIQNVKAMMGMLSGTPDKNSMLRLLASRNPALSQILTLLNNTGMDGKTAFYNLAREKGLDPDKCSQQIAAMLR
jgi:hypothetical protein